MECSSVASNQQIQLQLFSSPEEISPLNVSFAAQRAPSSLKLIINRRTIGFEDAEALQGEQVLCSLSAPATPSPLYPAPPLGHRSSPCRPTTWTSALSSSSSSSRTSSACVSLWRATRTSARPPRSQACCRLKAWGGRPRTHRARVARADARGHRAGSVAPPSPPPTPTPHHPHTHTASGLTAALCFRPAGLKLWGAPIFTTNIKDFKRVSGEKGE